MYENGLLLHSSVRLGHLQELTETGLLDLVLTGLNVMRLHFRRFAVELDDEKEIHYCGVDAFFPYLQQIQVLPTITMPYIDALQLCKLQGELTRERCTFTLDEQIDVAAAH